MALPKRATVLAIAFVFAMTACIGLFGCGKQPAATWEHGDIQEDRVTTAVTNMRSYYGITDEATWDSFVKERSYDTDSEANSQTATEKAIANAGGESAATEEKSEDKPEGTVEDLRNYMIEQLIRADIVDYKIKEMNITVSDQEVNEAVEQQRAYVEAQFMPGVFESVLQRQGYADLNAYKEDVKTQLAQAKLEKEVAGTTGEDGTESIDEEKLKAWMDEQYANANVKINPAPADLSYPMPSTSSSSSASDGEGTENTGSTESTQASSSSTKSGD